MRFICAVLLFSVLLAGCGKDEIVGCGKDESTRDVLLYFQGKHFVEIHEVIHHLNSYWNIDTTFLDTIELVKENDSLRFKYAYDTTYNFYVYNVLLNYDTCINDEAAYVYPDGEYTRDYKVYLNYGNDSIFVSTQRRSPGGETLLNMKGKK